MASLQQRAIQLRIPRYELPYHRPRPCVAWKIIVERPVLCLDVLEPLVELMMARVQTVIVIASVEEDIRPKKVAGGDVRVRDHVEHDSVVDVRRECTWTVQDGDP